jgi:hypothetical protein
MILIPVLIGAQLTMTVADSVPTLDVGPTCRSASSGIIGLQQDINVCLQDEKNAREQLVKEWSQFGAADKSSCTALARTGGDPSYTELLVCLEMARDARKLSKDGITGMGTAR